MKCKSDNYMKVYLCLCGGQNIYALVPIGLASSAISLLLPLLILPTVPPTPIVPHTVPIASTVVCDRGKHDQG